MKTINRSIALVRPKEAYAEWANSGDEDEPRYSLEEGQKDVTTYLLPVIEQEGGEEQILLRYFNEIFEHELTDWMMDKKLWTQPRDFEMFNEWFDVEFSTMVFDLSSEELVFEEL